MCIIIQYNKIASDNNDASFILFLFDIKHNFNKYT